jgi:hypothetical protein
MSQMSRGFNFDDFEEQIDEALADNLEVMRPVVRRPGEIGAVACSPLFQLWLDSHETPPDAA